MEERGPTSAAGPQTTAAQRYATGADTGDVAVFVSAFVPHAVLEVYRPGSERPTSTYEGHGELARIPPALARYSSTLHVLGPVEVTSVHDAVMTARVPCTAHHVGETAGGAVDTVMSIVYHDTLRLVENDWLIERREVRMSSIETVPVGTVPVGTVPVDRTSGAGTDAHQGR